MSKLFPAKYVTGFVFSLVLTVAALVVLYFDMSAKAGITVLLITGALQAGVQIVMFMHLGENEDKVAIWTHTYYAFFMVFVIVIGTLLAMIWGY